MDDYTRFKTSSLRNRLRLWWEETKLHLSEMWINLTNW